VYEHLARRCVEFADTDMGGMVHFARFFVYMETAEHEFLNALGTEVHFQVDGATIGWPKVAVSCEYLAPARLGDELTIHLRVLRKGEKSLTNGFEIRRGETLVARGSLTSACCRLDGPEGVRAVPIPATLAARIEEAPR
jgi:acyl-CoA thioester hydrolase